MEIEMKTEALGSRPDYPMQLVVAQRNMAFTPEKRGEGSIWVCKGGRWK
jgi:hypothetical protein